MKLQELRKIIREEIQRETSKGKDLNFYLDNFNLIKTQKLKSETKYTFSIPQEVIDQTNKNTPKYSDIYSKNDTFNIYVKNDKKGYSNNLMPKNIYIQQLKILMDYIDSI